MEPTNIEIDDFFRLYESSLKSLHSQWFRKNKQIELDDWLNNVRIELLNQIFSGEELYQSFFYAVNEYCKKIFIKPIVKETQYLCPACLYYGRSQIILLHQELLHCVSCEKTCQTTKDPQEEFLTKEISKHHKRGYRCSECQRFLPHPIDNVAEIICPYPDCLFVGRWEALKKMHHPTLNSKIAQQVSSEKNPDIKPQFDETTNRLLSIIRDQMNTASYFGIDSTTKHRQCVYQAFEDLVQEKPQQMLAYLSGSSKKHLGFQHQVFQRYIFHLENSLPFLIRKNRKTYRIESLLDESFCLFGGISTFETMVNDKLIVPNKTTEFYIGGRLANYTKPYYIGKLLSIIDVENQMSLMRNVEEYSFNKIQMKNIATNTCVRVSHLRVPPHYQMGGMVYVNRVRQNITKALKE